MSRDEIRFRFTGPNRERDAAIVMGELQRRAQAAEQPAPLPADDHVVVEHQEMWRCMATRPDGPMDGMRDDLRCVLVEHGGNMHMRWDGGRAEYWVES